MITENLFSKTAEKQTPFYPLDNNYMFWEKPKEKTEFKEEFLTREETALLCRVKSLTTLWNWAKKGILVPALQSGRKPLYKKSDVINFLEGKGGKNVR